MSPTLPPGSHPSPISSIIQHLHGASAGQGGGRAQPEPFTLSAWSQTNPGREPPVALVLADWSSRLAQVHANLSGSTPHQQRNQILTSLWHMSQDTRLPIDVRTRVSNEATSMRAQSGREVHDFQEFRSWVQDESAARTSHLQTPQDTGHQVSLPASNAPTATTMQRRRPDQSLANSVRIPSDARALANWASEFEKVFASMKGLTDAERQQRIGARLWSMAEDQSVPEEFRLAAVDELSNVHAPDGVVRFSSFEQAVRRESLARAGNAREAINELLGTATTSIHQQLSRSDPLPHDMNGTSAASDAVFGSSMAQGRNPSATRESAATADIALPMAIPMPIDQLNGNQNPPVQLVNNSNPAFSEPPARRAPVDAGIPHRISEVMDRMLANPMTSHNRIAQDLCGERSLNLEYAKFSVLQARNHLAFGASPQTRSTVQHHLNLSRNLQDPAALKAVGRALAQRNANHNPIALKTLAAAAEKYVGEGGQQATLTLPDLAGYVDEGRERIYEAFINKPEGYVTAGPVSPGPISVEDSRRAMAANVPPQPPQPVLAGRVPQVAHMPVSGNGGNAGGVQETEIASSEPGKRQRVSGEFGAASDPAPVAGPSTNPPWQTMPSTTGQVSVYQAMPSGEQTSGPIAMTSSAQPALTAASTTAMQTPHVQPVPLTPLPGDAASLQAQPRQVPQPQFVQPMQPAQPLQALAPSTSTQPLPAPQLQPQLQTVQQLHQAPPLQAPQQPLQMQSTQPQPQPTIEQQSQQTLQQSR